MTTATSPRASRYMPAKAALSVPSSRRRSISSKRSSIACSTSRAKRARRRRSDSRPRRLDIESIIGHARLPQLRQRARTHAADSGFAEPDPNPDLLEREAVLVVEDEHPPLELRQENERAPHLEPAWIVPRAHGDRRLQRAKGLAAAIDPVVERLDRERVRAPAARSPLAASGAREGIGLAQRVEHLAAYATRGEGGEARAAALAISACRLYETDDAPREQIFAIVGAALRR